MLAGADGYKKRWVVALDEGDGRTSLALAGTFSDLVALPALDLLVIDVPIGLPEVGARRCDGLARAMIGRRRSSVFPAPIRPMLPAASYGEACDLRYRAEGKRCSIYLFGILPLIRDVDEQMSTALQEHIREGHPEVSFTALADGKPMGAHKSKPEGQAERRALLRAVFPDLDDSIARFGRPGAITDMLDAYVLLWSARRLAAGEGSSLPERPERDPRGLRMEIAY